MKALGRESVRKWCALRRGERESKQFVVAS